jgi:hypothetical protein
LVVCLDRVVFMLWVKTLTIPDEAYGVGLAELDRSTRGSGPMAFSEVRIYFRIWSRAPEILTGSIVPTIVATIFGFACFYSRFIVSKSCELDDLLMSISLACLLHCSYTGQVIITSGCFTHLDYFDLRVYIWRWSTHGVSRKARNSSYCHENFVCSASSLPTLPHIN